MKTFFLATRPQSFSASAMPVLVTAAGLFWAVRFPADKDAINHLDEQTAKQQLVSCLLLFTGIMGSAGLTVIL